MLGAGMDTRPWRLPLDPQLSWFEVDRADVLAAKQRALQEAGAGFTAASTPPAAAAADSSKQTSSSGSSGSGSSGSSGVQHPLRVGHWACASADLQKVGWVRKLQEAGLQANIPTVSERAMGTQSSPASWNGCSQFPGCQVGHGHLEALLLVCSQLWVSLSSVSSTCACFT